MNAGNHAATLTDDEQVNSRRTGRARLIIGYLAIIAILPYLLLKAAWIAGSTVGIVSPSPADAAVVQGGNVVTAAMEIIAIVIILMFTHSWGERIPAWLVLGPTWVATGLLAPFVITGPAVAASALGGAFVAGDGSLAAWVGPLVYLGFGAQAIGISASFVLYALHRWPQAFQGRLSDHHPGPDQSVLVLFACLAAVPLVAVAVVRASWAVGSTLGLSPYLAESRGVAERLSDAGTALFSLVAVAGMLALVLHRPGRTRTWIPIAIAWVGAGAVFGSGLYSLILLLAATAGTGVGTTQTGLVPFADLVQVMVGTVIAVIGSLALHRLNARSTDSR